MAIDRCICTGVSFTDVKCCAQKTGATLDEVLEELRCGEGCGLCLPYIKLVLLTGLTEFPVLSADEYKRLIAKYTQPPVSAAPAGER